MDEVVSNSASFAGFFVSESMSSIPYEANCSSLFIYKIQRFSYVFVEGSLISDIDYLFHSLVFCRVQRAVEAAAVGADGVDCRGISPSGVWQCAHVPCELD